MTLDQLFDCWRSEVSNKKNPGSRISLVSNILRRTRKDNKLRYLFNFRLAQYLYGKGGIWRTHARGMQQRLNRKYAVDIDLNAVIGPGLRIAHLPGVVISGHARIGRNCFIRQNTTIGIKTLGLPRYELAIGDNVSIGANSCIIADALTIGDNATIGAMSLVNKCVPANCTFYNKRVASQQFNQD